MFKPLLIVFLVFASLPSVAQKVGLVMSGGAAKGIAHVGVLKALEENEIPIDNVVGTSMGGIIAGCYAAGMSPYQIEDLVLSEQFLRWVNGLPEVGYNYYYHQGEVNPNFLKLNLSLDSILNFQLNSSIASDVSLNFALAETMAQASAISGENFDSLFVPLRVVAADIFTQNEVILAKGNLSDALRATQTVPFFYNPIRVQGKYLFDGGVYNNFPVDVSQKTFQPDVIIGCNVSSKVYDEYPFDVDEKLISKSLLFLLLDKSDPASVPSNGVYIQPDLKNFTSFDFGKAKSLIDSGYAQTIRQMDEIKAKVKHRVPCEEVAIKRNKFNDRSSPMVFDQVIFKGFNTKQKRYLRQIFYRGNRKSKELYYGSIKKNYFRLVSEDYFSNVYPNIFYNPVSNRFQFQLTRRPQKNFQVDFGGVLATRDISNIFLGLNFYNFNNQLLHFYAGFHTGNFYKSANIRARIDFPYDFYIEPVACFNNFDFLGTNDFLNSRFNSTVLRRIDRKIGFHMGWPLGSIFKTSVGIDAINNRDNYGNTNVFISSDTLDEMRLRGYKAEIAFATSTLNRKQYATSGSAYSIKGQFFDLTQLYESGTTAAEQKTARINHQWVRLKASAEQYFDAGWFRPGYYVEGVFSNQPFFSNYKGTIINAPAFFPLQDSRTLLLENFRAFNYIAGGVRSVFTLKNRLDLRLEGYVFKPIEYLSEQRDQDVIARTDFRKVYVAATTGLVLHSPIGPISFSVNYYDDEEHRLGVLLHVGFLLYNNSSLE